MKTIGIIAEYNPFHTGHAYQIEKAKRDLDADYVIAVMSGDFVQCGEPAVMDKRMRAEAALRCGIDLVLELPIEKSTGSAEEFAVGAVSLLAGTGVVDYISFGSETMDTEKIYLLADLFIAEPEPYRLLLKENLGKGMSFPAARSAAACEYLNMPECSDILLLPNTILAVEYAKAVKRLGARIELFPIKRSGASFHGGNLEGIHTSATALRKNAYKLGIQNESQDECDEYLSYIPEALRNMYTSTYEKFWPVEADDFSLLLFEKLISKDKEELSAYYDVSAEIAARIVKLRNSFASYSSFADMVVSKNTTLSHVKRAFLHILLDISKINVYKYEKISDAGYAKVLGFRDEAAPLLAAIKKAGTIQLVSRPAEAKALPLRYRNMLQKDMQASMLYQAVVSQKYNVPFRHDLENPIIKL